MTDTHDPATRSRNMAAVKGKNTKPEILLRKVLFRRGFRFRLHRDDLPGKPDIVLPKFRAAIFVHGCFWHGHRGCLKARLPATRKDFWEAKITTTKKRDRQNVEALREQGWRVLEVWECSVKGRGRLDHAVLSDLMTHWIIGESDAESLEGCTATTAQASADRRDRSG